jgi:hypothetical protein
MVGELGKKLQVRKDSTNDTTPPGGTNDNHPRNGRGNLRKALSTYYVPPPSEYSINS